MQEKLIITLWKAQLKQISKDEAIYCRLTYNGTERNSKPTTQEKNLVWKETFIFPLSKQDSPLKLQFIGLKEGQAIHFAKDQVAESMSLAKSIVNIPLNDQHHGSLPCKVDIIDKQQQPIGKIFIEYEVMKTEVTYTVQKQMDYLYLLKLTNFRVSFVRRLKNNPKFYLHFLIDGREQKEDLPFELEQNGVYIYNYPVKLYLKKEIEAEIQLYVKQQPAAPEYSTNRLDYQTETSFSESMFSSDKKTFKSSIGKKDRLLLELSKQKISALFDLSFKRDVKVNRKLPLSTIIKFQKREIGNIEFQAESFFRTKEELQEIQEQKKGLNPEKDSKAQQRKKSQVKQSNGIITINSILGKLELFNDAIIEKKNMSLEIKLGNQVKESSILEHPGKQIIFIDTFVFKRMWEETMRIVINIHNRQNQKMPTFFAELKLRELFELGRYISKKIKLKDQHKNYSGELVIDVEYKQIQEKRSPSLKESMATISEIPQEEVQEVKARKKREEIEERMKVREQIKEQSKELNSMSTLAVLQSNDIILPPLRSISRLSTMSPKPEKFKGANVFNINGSIRFTRSPRFDKVQRQGYESYTYVRDSDFDGKKKRGASIGLGQKHDFTKLYNYNPGVGRYEIPSVWDKYK